MKKLFTSESVTEGHPDKICDMISDAVLDSILSQDPRARVACETFATTGLVNVMGEITTEAYVDIPAVVRETIRCIGYDRAKYGFDCDTCGVLSSIHEQSPDIAMGVDKSFEAKAGEEAHSTGAGDQGMMFGFACDETPELMPLPISLAHKLAKQLTKVRKDGMLSYLRPDGKTQVTVEYDGDKPVRLDTIVLSTQHDPEVSLETIRREIRDTVIQPIAGDMMDADTVVHINPTGRFVIGGPAGDTGLTGRKIIVDTYGGYARSAAYLSRYIAKNIVAAGAAKKCEVQLAYAIGVANPVSLMIDTFGTGLVSDESLSDYIMQNVDMRPDAIIQRFDLLRPIYTPLAAYGHMGREDLNAPWEKTDLAPAVRAAFSL